VIYETMMMNKEKKVNIYVRNCLCGVLLFVDDITTTSTTTTICITKQQKVRSLVRSLFVLIDDLIKMDKKRFMMTMMC